MYRKMYFVNHFIARGIKLLLNEYLIVPDKNSIFEKLIDHITSLITKCSFCGHKWTSTFLVVKIAKAKEL